MNKKLSIKTFSNLCNATLIGNSQINNIIETILYDSRRLNTTNGTIFFAIKTSKDNGEKYIPYLYSKGIKMFVMQSMPRISYPDATVLVVKDTIKALHILAKAYRERFPIQMIGITGSNGKTITKDWIVKLINGDKNISYNPKSYNSQIGVAVSLYEMNEDSEIGIFEAGISMKGEMNELREMIQPTIGVFTNIGDAHAVNFSCLEEKIEEKLKLMEHCHKVILHDDNPLLYRKISAFCQHNSIELITWGDNSRDKYKLSNIETEICLPFEDKASIENAINAYITCLEIGINNNHLKERIKHLEQIEMRFQIKSGINNSIIVDDSYSCDLKSLEIALDYLNTQNKSKKIVILSSLEQTNTNLKELYSQINDLLQNKHISSLVGIGIDFYNSRDLLKLDNQKFYRSVDEFLFNLRRRDFSNAAILIKGASKQHFERISSALSAKRHESVLEINLSALQDNVRHFRSKIDKKTMVMAMVKAGAYGCGGYEVARSLENAHLADYFTVAFADEGIELRSKGIQTPIMVMTPEIDAKEAIIQYHLEPVVNSFSTLNYFINERIHIHIKLDTGMHRLGFEENDLDELITTIKQHPNIKIKSIFSHLYGSDDMALDKYTIGQINLYEEMSKKIINAFDYKIIRHICNSAATIRFPKAHYDMVRLGIGMYGIGVNVDEQRSLRFVHRLRTIVTRTRSIKAGEDVSYSRKFVSQTPMRIGVIPIGYGDGLSRRLGNENLEVWVKGHYCKIIGNICMDMCMIDITGTDIKEGDSVIIFGNENPVFKLSDAMGTIPYEIFTSISERIKKIYYQE